MNDNNKDTQKRKIMLVQERNRVKKRTEMRRISGNSLQPEMSPAEGSTTQRLPPLGSTKTKVGRRGSSKLSRLKFHMSDVLELPPAVQSQ